MNVIVRKEDRQKKKKPPPPRVPSSTMASQDTYFDLADFEGSQGGTQDFLANLFNEPSKNRILLNISFSFLLIQIRRKQSINTRRRQRK